MIFLSLLARVRELENGGDSFFLRKNGMGFSNQRQCNHQSSLQTRFLLGLLSFFKLSFTELFRFTLVIVSTIVVDTGINLCSREKLS